MPYLPDPRRNFIHALSDFWTVFFKDTTQIQTYFKGAQINLGQLYLELLETVLGTSLKHLPLFSKQYYKQFTISEDTLYYAEGPSPSQDRWASTPSGLMVEHIEALMNKIIEPTEVLEQPLHFHVANGKLSFNVNLFNVDGLGNSITNFPVRRISRQFPATFSEPGLRKWSSTGVKIGDTLRFNVLGTVVRDAIVSLYDGATIFLDSTHEEYKLDVEYRSFSASVLRRGFDYEKKGALIDPYTTTVTRLDPGGPTEAVLLAGTSTFDLSGCAKFKGPWVAGSAYTVGDIIVTPGGDTARAKVSHLAPPVYDPGPWELLSNKYFYLADDTNPANNGLFFSTTAIGGTVTLNRPTPFLAGGTLAASVYFVQYSQNFLGAVRPVTSLPNTLIDEDSLTIFARRKHPVTVLDASGAPVVYPANEAVIEGIDYLVDYEAGTITLLSGWDPLFQARADYTWWYDIQTYTYATPTAWAPATSYALGDRVIVSRVVYNCIEAHISGASFDASKFKQYAHPFSYEVTHNVREIAMWGCDVLVDRETLYNNFGSLLAAKKPTSEQYRQFLLGVSQLFVIGPTLERFESALNVMANLPVIREDGEKLIAYSNGIDFSAADGQLIDRAYGNDGVLDAGTSTFSAASATFYTTDVGVSVRVQQGATVATYVVTAVLSPTSVTVSPVPANGINLRWQFRHLALSNRFRTSSYVFSAAEEGALILIDGASNDQNNGSFRIEAVEDATTIVLSAPFGFIDETGLSWRLSKSGQQLVRTNQNTYQVPVQVPVRPDVALASSLNSLTFEAFETITDAVQVTDYVQDPTWWHNTVIPPAILDELSATTARRSAFTQFIEHRASPLDGALVGDYGLAVGVDDNGNPGTPRAGFAFWTGANQVVLAYAPGVPVANSRDVGGYLKVATAPFKGQFKITAIDPLGTTLTLERFPPPSAAGEVPPKNLSVELDPLIFRRSVGFVMMDRFLKFHGVKVSIRPETPLPLAFMTEASSLLAEAKPAFTYVYLTTPLNFEEVVTVAEELLLGVGLRRLEKIYAVDTAIKAGPPSLLLADDAFRFINYSQVIPAAPGVYALTPPLPVGGAPRFHAVKGWFDLTVLTGGRRLTEDVDYTFDRLNGVVTVLAPGLPVNTTFNAVIAIIRTRLPIDPLDPGETRIVVAGADPSLWWHPLQTTIDTGVIDRAVQLTPL
jgi:hypothetical protein